MFGTVKKWFGRGLPGTPLVCTLPPRCHPVPWTAPSPLWGHPPLERTHPLGTPLGGSPPPPAVGGTHPRDHPPPSGALPPLGAPQPWGAPSPLGAPSPFGGTLPWGATPPCGAPPRCSLPGATPPWGGPACWGTQPNTPLGSCRAPAGPAGPAGAPGACWLLGPAGALLGAAGVPRPGAWALPWGPSGGGRPAVWLAGAFFYLG